MTAGHDLADQDFPMAKEIPTAAGHKVWTNVLIK